MPAAASVNEPDEPILEGIVVTLDDRRTPNIAPMGPRVDRQITRLTLRPFQTAHTYRNLKATGSGVFHVVDDVELLARAAVGQLDPPPPLAPIEAFSCPRLAEACRWFAFRVESLDDAAERTKIDCCVVASGEVRPFFGFNRAKHAVLEAAILATRIGILPADEIRRELERLAVPVQKTAGSQEHRAFEFLCAYIHEKTTGPFSPLTSDL
jgi:uncharacterized protein